MNRDLSSLILSVSSQYLNDPHNKDYQNESDGVDDTPPTSREGTPYCEPLCNTIELRTTTLPKSLASGWFFGSDRGSCDIWLGPSSDGVGKLHFAITFNWTSMQYLLVNYSSRGTRWGMAGTKIIREQHVIPPKQDTIIYAGRIQIGLEAPDRGEHEDAFIASWRRLREQFMQSHPNLTMLRVGPKGTDTPDVLPDIWAIHGLINDGGQASVKQLINRTTGDILAAKIFRKKGCSCKKKGECPYCEAEMRARNEARILSKLQHDHIIKYEDLLEKPEQIIIVMEMAIYGDFHRFPKKNASNVRTMLLQCLQAMVFIHKNGVVHRDIKPPNILITSLQPFITKLGDFGFSTEKEEMDTFCGTEFYCAPEISSPGHKWRGNPYTSAVDVWNFGMVMFTYTVEGPRKHPDLYRYIELNYNKGCMGGLLPEILNHDPCERPLSSRPLERFERVTEIEIVTEHLDDEEAPTIKPNMGSSSYEPIPSSRRTVRLSSLKRQNSVKDVSSAKRSIRKESTGRD